MQIYLIQHGDAKSEDEDSKRPLSEAGKMETKAIALKLRELGVSPMNIFHSPKLRAKETAEIFAITLTSKIEETDGLKPNDDPDIIAEKISLLENIHSYFFVGHLPNIERLASLLIIKKTSPPIHISRNSAILCLENSTGNWRIKYYLLPEMA